MQVHEATSTYNSLKNINSVQSQAVEQFQPKTEIVKVADFLLFNLKFSKFFTAKKRIFAKI